jgi:hypothetical protein
VGGITIERASVSAPFPAFVSSPMTCRVTVLTIDTRAAWAGIEASPGEPAFET